MARDCRRPFGRCEERHSHGAVANREGQTKRMQPAVANRSARDEKEEARERAAALIRQGN